VRTRLVPEEFTLVPYDATVIAELVEDSARLVGLPPDVPVTLEVDEELPSPLTGTLADVGPDGEARLWISGANFEDTRRPRQFAPEQARADLVAMLLRVVDRRSPQFVDAPAEGELTLAERAAWDVSAYGRAARLGAPARESRLRYEFRLQHGFTDVADAAFERLASASSCSWDEVRAVCRETGAAERPPARVPVDLLRRRT